MPNEERESAIAMGLARRTYLYRLFHVVFGSRPTGEGVAKVLGGETPALLGSVGEALARDGFADLAGRTLGPSGRSLAACAEDARAWAERAQGETADPERAQALAARMRASYDRLFQVPGEHYVHPWESPYTGKESVVFQESTLDVRSFYHAAGFKLRAEKRFPDDHIAAMMDYLGALSQRAYEAFADGRDDEAARTLATQRQFVDRHLLNWVDQFAAKVIEHDAQGCYGVLAGGMAAFAALDRVLSEQVEAELAEPE